MARKSFAMNREPHVADLGDGTELHFVPEVYGDRFLDAYGDLKEAQAALGAEDKEISELSGDRLRSLYGAIRTYLAKMMTDESAAIFNRYEVSQAGTVVEVFQVEELALTCCEGLGGGARVIDKSLRLPDRVLIELMEWSLELYGGGAKARPTGPSKGSSAGPKRTGTSGRASSRSKA
ncbi:hypothetical protein [Streptomyces sp. AMCC400023]|uniref:hypothetical protein n=1 Tax=Streptomyces sp. AMCC400023 TaxID=2056258 RepID=UPI001F2CF58E|nr:hypothetical protein [Streptomyces sp. AMCC400023]UJV42993.1 hypothetical protein CVT30_26920 [Streptomyces sp. AMCC400023]